MPGAQSSRPRVSGLTPVSCSVQVGAPTVEVRITGVRTPAGVSSRFRSLDDVKADMARAQGRAISADMARAQGHPIFNLDGSVHLEEEEQRMTPEQVNAFFNLDGLL